MDIRKLQRAIVDGLEDVKAQDIVVFNTEHLSPLFERVIIASGIILHALVFGLAAAKHIAPVAVVERLVPLGVLIFLSAGLPGLFAGKRFLDYTVYSHDPLHGHEWGVFIVESGVIVTVAATMIAIFYAFADRGRA